jgi:hypothetical protein
MRINKVKMRTFNFSELIAQQAGRETVQMRTEPTVAHSHVFKHVPLLASSSSFHAQQYQCMVV